MEQWQEIAIGLIWMVVLGPSVGNYATSVVYRLPFGQTPFEKNPYCGACGTMLAPKDLFPIISYYMTGGKCRYCGDKIPMCYTWVEIACGLIFVINFLVFGISEAFLLVTTLGVFLTILVGLEYRQSKLYSLILSYIIGLGAMYRILLDGTIFDAFYSGFAMLFITLILWRIQLLFNKEISKTTAPDYVWLALMIGVCVPLHDIPVALLVVVFIYGLQRLFTSSRMQTLAVSIGLYSALLWPEMSGYLQVSSNL